MWHGVSKLNKLRRICSADYGTDRAVTATAGSRRRELLDVCRYALVHRLAVAREILQESAARIRSLHQDEHARAALAGGIHKRLKAVVAEIGAHGESIRMPRALFPTEVRAGVRLGRRANVVALGIDNHEQPGRAGLMNHFAHCRHATRSKLLEEGGLHFHDWHERRDDFDD